MVLIAEKTYFLKDPEGGPTFSKRWGGGGQTFSIGGVQMLISIETHITCDFPGAGGWSGSPIPLWIRT